MEAGNPVHFAIRVNKKAVAVQGVVLYISGDTAVLLCDRSVPGVQCIKVGKEDLANIRVPASSLNKGWANDMTDADYQYVLPGGSLETIKEHVMAMECEGFTSMIEEDNQKTSMDNSLGTMESMGKNLHKLMAGTMQMVAGLQREMRPMNTGAGTSLSSPNLSHRQDLKQTIPPRMKGLAKGRSLWGITSEDEEEEDEEEAEEEDLFENFMGKKKEVLKGRPGVEAHTSSMTTEQMIQMQMLEFMQEANSSKKKKRKDRSDTSSSSESDGIGADKLRGKGFRGVRKLRRRYQRHPRRLIQGYVTRTKEIIGVHHRDQRWGFRDLSWKVKRTFGKMVGLGRCHLLLQEVLQLQMEGQHEHATALVCQKGK